MKKILIFLLALTTTISKAQNTDNSLHYYGYFDERDGFLWYLVQKDSLYGAMDSKGKMIIPIEYSDIIYESDRLGFTADTYLHWFKVKKNGYEGAYSPTGKCYISTQKCYDRVFLRGTYYVMNEKGFCRGVASWEYKRGDFSGVLDVDGNEVISSTRGYTSA